MTIGVAAVVVLTALGEGARLYVTGQFADIGANLLILVPGKSETTGMLPGLTGVPNDLTLDDAEAVGRQVAGVTKVSPLVMANETVAAGERRRQVAVLGTTREYFEIRSLKRLRRRDPAGRRLDPRPAGGGPRQRTCARDLFGGCRRSAR